MDIKDFKKSVKKKQAYRVKCYPGIAFRFHSWPTKWIPDTYIDIDDQGEEFENESVVEGEFEEDSSGPWVYLYMVGDDAKHKVDVADISFLKETDFCHSCGQVGCGCNVYE